MSAGARALTAVGRPYVWAWALPSASTSTYPYVPQPRRAAQWSAATATCEGREINALIAEHKVVHEYVHGVRTSFFFFMLVVIPFSSSFSLLHLMSIRLECMHVTLSSPCMHAWSRRIHVAQEPAPPTRSWGASRRWLVAVSCSLFWSRSYDSSDGSGRWVNERIGVGKTTNKWA